MWNRIVSAFAGDPNKKVIDNLRPLVEEIEEQESRMQAMSDEQLRDLTLSLKSRISEIEDDEFGFDNFETDDALLLRIGFGY